MLVDRQKGMKSISLTPAGESFLLALKWQEVSREIGNARNPGSAFSLAIGGSESSKLQASAKSIQGPAGT